MGLVVVSSPGAGGPPHWSHAAAAAIAALARRSGAPVHWLAVAHAGQQLPAAPDGVERRVLDVPHARPAHVATASRHLPTELELTALLRQQPASTVLHAGIGAGGSPNVPWLADRLGAPAFALARGVEVVCHRADLLPPGGAACPDAAVPQQCSRCCPAGWGRRGNAHALLARSDLLAASLLAATAVFVPGETDVAALIAFGVPRRALTIGVDPQHVATRLLR
jgi:hypothetical protein